MKIFALLATLLSFSAFAGDSYFICEDSNGDFIIDEYIGEKDVISDSYYYMSDYFFNYKLNTETFELDASLVDVHGGGTLDSKQVKLSYFERVEFYRGITCYITD